MTARTCEFRECGRAHHARGYCSGHNRQIAGGLDLHPIRTMRQSRPKGATLERDADGNKFCILCAEWQPEAEFYASPITRDGLGVQCKGCMKWGNLLRLFGLTPLQYAEMLAAQGGGCGICKAKPDGARRFPVDHNRACCPTDKSCGKCVRAILCSGCNAGLGMFRDNPETVMAAAIYLEVHQ